MKLELLTNTTVVDEAIRFVSDKQQHSSTETKLSNDSNDIVEVKKAIIRENEDPTTTTNHVF
jgi:hypothetical protein